MAKPLLVIAETDESYLGPLEMKVAETLGDTVDLEIISDAEYFEEYFTNPRKIDVLVICEELYTERLHMHHVEKIFLLAETMDEQEDVVHEVEGGPVKVYKLFKFCNVSMLVSYIIQSNWKSEVSESQTPQLVVFLSAAGGAGSTTLCMGASACMRQNLKKAFYINFQRHQNFHYYLKNKSTLPIEACACLQKKDAAVYEKLKPYISREDFTYLPPLKASREALGIPEAAYGSFARAVQKSGDFDYIMVDMGTELTPENLEFLNYANKVFIVTTQDAYGAFKLKMLQQSISCTDKEKYRFICNCFDKEEENLLLNMEKESQVVVSEYIEYDEKAVGRGIQGITSMQGIQKVAYMIL